MNLRKLSHPAILALGLFLGQSAQAQEYDLYQEGFSGGGVLTGSLSGIDTSGDGTLDLSVDSITAFSISFSGDSFVPSFSLGLTDLAGLVYMLGGTKIGDDGQPGTGEGLVAFSGDLNTTGIAYFTGIGPLGGAGAVITNYDTNQSTSTSHDLSISAVPEPQSWGMMLVGLGMVSWMGLRGTRRK